MPRFIAPVMSREFYRDLINLDDDRWRASALFYSGQDSCLFTYRTFLNMLEQDRLDAAEMASLVRHGVSLGVRALPLDEEVEVVLGTIDPDDVVIQSCN